MRLQDIKIVFICPDHNERYHKRKLHMENMLARIGCKNVHHYKSGTEKFPICISNSVINILSENIDTPVLILEDDVIFKGIDTFECDDSVDAVYLGLGKWAGHPTENRNDDCTLKVEPYSMTQVRIKNMLSGHAVFYKSRKYKEAVISILKSNLDGIAWETDVLIARLQPQFTILANMKPLFYQSAVLNTGHNNNAERLTNFQIGYMIGFGQGPPPENELIEDGSESKDH
jgi:hypothetical protein